MSHTTESNRQASENITESYFTKVHFNFFKFLGPLAAKFYYRAAVYSFVEY